MLNHDLHTAAQQNAAIFESIWAFDDILLPQQFHDNLSQRFNSNRVDKQTSNTSTPTNRHYSNTLPHYATHVELNRAQWWYATKSRWSLRLLAHLWNYLKPDRPLSLVSVKFFFGFCPSRTKLISALSSFWKNSWPVIITSVDYYIHLYFKKEMVVVKTHTT